MPCYGVPCVEVLARVRMVGGVSRRGKGRGREEDDDKILIKIRYLITALPCVLAPPSPPPPPPSHPHIPLPKNLPYQGLAHIACIPPPFLPPCERAGLCQTSVITPNGLPPDSWAMPWEAWPMCSQDGPDICTLVSFCGTDIISKPGCQRSITV